MARESKREGAAAGGGGDGENGYEGVWTGGMKAARVGQRIGGWGGWWRGNDGERNRGRDREAVWAACKSFDCMDARGMHVSETCTFINKGKGRGGGM